MIPNASLCERLFSTTDVQAEDLRFLHRFLWLFSMIRQDIVLLPSIGQEATAWRTAPLDLFDKNCHDLSRIGLLMALSAALLFNRRQRIFQVQNKKLFTIYVI